MKKYMLFSLLSLLFVQCEKDTPEINQEIPIIDNTSYSISGYLYSGNSKVSNANIRLDDKPINQTITDSNGYFLINDVDSGNHKLTAYSIQDNGGFLELESQLTVNNDVHFEKLLLPAPILIFTPKNVNEGSMEIYWNKTDANDFREYKLYMHSTSGLDETTGTLIHVSTSFNDTSVVINNLSPKTGYFFRVYVMNDLGRIGGSNIVSDTTLTYAFLPNGNFEDKTDLSWLDSSSCKMVEYVNEFAKSGEYCLHIITDTTSDFIVQGYLTRTISPQFSFQKGKTYKFSSWIKQSGKKFNGNATIYETGAVIYLGSFGNTLGSAALEIYSESDKWVYKEKIFTCDIEYHQFWIQIGSCHEDVWFDDLKIELID